MSHGAAAGFSDVVYFGKIVDVQGDSVVVKPDWANSDEENLFVRNFITSGWELCAESK